MDIIQLERLARISLSDDDRQRVQHDLERIITMIKTLDAADTKGVEPLVYLSNPTEGLRPDVVAPHLSRAAAMQNAASTDGVFFKVPKVIEQ